MVIRAFVGAEIANCLPRSNSLTAFGLLLWPASVAHSEWNSSVALSAAAASTSVSEKFEKWAFQLAPVTQTGASLLRKYVLRLDKPRQIIAVPPTCVVCSHRPRFGLAFFWTFLTLRRRLVRIEWYAMSPTMTWSSNLTPSISPAS